MEGTVTISFSDMGWEAQTEGVPEYDEDGSLIGNLGCSSSPCTSFVEALGQAIGICEDLDIYDIQLSKSAAKLAIRDLARMTKKFTGERRE